MRGETDYRRLLADLAQRKHASDANRALVGPSHNAEIEMLLSVFADVFHVAHHGVMRHEPRAPGETGRQARDLRPESPGTSRFQAMTPHAESKPPQHDPRAQALVRKARRQMQKLAAEWLNALDEIVGESGGE
jgi:hypothetical protein